jgi:hypothetical protein
VGLGMLSTIQKYVFLNIISSLQDFVVKLYLSAFKSERLGVWSCGEGLGEVVGFGVLSLLQISYCCLQKKSHIAV